MLLGARGSPLPPSLVNIYKELHADLGIEPARHGNLEAWARQGVLLLNTVLTVRGGAARRRTRARAGRRSPTRSSVRSTRKDHPVVFILWGSYARRKKQLIDTARHHVIESAHPSPLSAHNGSSAPAVLADQRRPRGRRPAPDRLAAVGFGLTRSLASLSSLRSAEFRCAGLRRTQLVGGGEQARLMPPRRGYRPFPHPRRSCTGQAPRPSQVERADRLERTRRPADEDPVFTGRDDPAVGAPAAERPSGHDDVGVRGHAGVDLDALGTPRAGEPAGPGRRPAARRRPVRPRCQHVRRCS